MYLAENIIYLRKRLNKSQSDIAQLLNVGVKRYAAWEQGNSQPNHDFVINISSLFEVSLDDLIKKDLSKVNQDVANQNLFIARYNTSAPNIKQAIDLLLN